VVLLTLAESSTIKQSLEMFIHQQFRESKNSSDAKQYEISMYNDA
jgi:hypothetical protein